MAKKVTKKVRMGMYSFHLDEERKQKLKKKSQKIGISQGAIIREALDHYFWGQG